MLSIQNILKDNFIPYKYSFRALSKNKALCIVKKGRDKYVCLKSSEKLTGFDNVIKEYKEDNIHIIIFRLSWNNYLLLKNNTNLTPKKINKKASFGTGDRIGMSTAPMLKSLSKYDIFPIIAQHTPAEIQTLGKSYRLCLLDAIMGILESGYKGDWGADADNIFSEDHADQATDADYSMYTADISSFINSTEYTEENFEFIKNNLNDISKEVIKEYNFLPILLKNQINADEENIIFSACVYEKGLEKAISLYKRICKHKSDFDFEVAFDKQNRITTPYDYIYTVLYLKKAGVKLTSISPKFFGNFNPGWDFEGDKNLFFKQLKKLKDINDILDTNKISLHSSDKFSIYGEFREILDSNYHIKIGGSSWHPIPFLCAIKNKELFSKMYNIALERNAEPVNMYNKEHPELYIKDKSICMLFHKNYNFILKELKEDIYDFLNTYEKDYYKLLEKHIDKHFIN